VFSFSSVINYKLVAHMQNVLAKNPWRQKHMFELVYTKNSEPFFLPSGRYCMTEFLLATMSIAKQR
jgi:hypothetical protein